MPTVYREKGFQFFVYPNDHLPAHVHIFHADGEIKIDVSGTNPLLISINGKFGRKTIRKSLEIANQNLKKLQTEWEKLHGPII